MSESTKPTVIFLMGPTAAGKTDLALTLHDEMNAELISVDSALIYRDMDIGTAKPDAQILARYPHHLVDIRDPAESYSAADFCEDALGIIQTALTQKRLPVLVGGTMMYYNALKKGMAPLPTADEALRAEIEKEAAEKGWPAMHAKLALLDPESGARLKPTDSQRIERALEVFLLTGIAISEHWRRQEQQTLPFNILPLALMPKDRALLHQRIEQRFDLMLEQGFEEEVQKLFARGDLNKDMPSIRCVGYRQMWEYLEGEMDYDTMRFKGVVATRQLAKRQLTWLRGWEGLHWLDSIDNNLQRNALNLIRSAII